jgi:hypothetical protein
MFALCKQIHSLLSFKINKDVIKRLREKKIPEQILQKLENLKNSQFVGEANFINSLEVNFGENELDKYKDEIIFTSAYLDATIFDQQILIQT